MTPKREKEDAIKKTIENKPVVVVKTLFDDTEVRTGVKKLPILVLMIVLLGSVVIVDGKYYLENRRHVILVRITHVEENGITVFEPVSENAEEKESHGHDGLATNPENFDI
mgnify:CR=1 FL=1